MQIDHQIELKHIGKISTSPYMDNILIIHIDSVNNLQNFQF